MVTSTPLHWKGLVIIVYGTPGATIVIFRLLVNAIKQFAHVIFKPAARPQPAFGRLWACAWLTEIVFVKVCVYLSMFIRTHPREQNRLITVKAAFT